MRWIQRSLVSCLLSLPFLCQAEPLDSARKAELENMLIQDCGSCHGLTFKGGLGPSLLPQDLQNKPREFLLHTILNGRPGTAMPPWYPLMTRAEAEWMIDQLLSKQEP